MVNRFRRLFQIEELNVLIIGCIISCIDDTTCKVLIRARQRMLIMYTLNSAIDFYRSAALMLSLTLLLMKSTRKLSAFVFRYCTIMK